MGFIQRGTANFIRANVALFSGGFVTFAILYSTQPLMPIFSRQFQISPALSSLTLSFSTLTLSIFMLVTSTLSESWSRKNIMAPALFLSALLAIFTAMSPDFATMLVLRALEGIVLAGFPAIAMAYVNEEFHPSSLGMAMGLYVSGNSVGGMMGRIVIGMVSDAFSWRIALLATGVISFAFSIWFWIYLPKSENFVPRRKHGKAVLNSFLNHLKDPGLLSLYCIAFLLMGQFVSLYNYIGYLLMDAPYHLSQTAVGFIFIVYLVGTFSSTWNGKLADKVGRSKVLRLNILISLLGTFITLSAPLVIKFLGVAIFTFGFFGGHSVASSWVGKRAPSDKAQASSLYLLFYYAGSSIVGVIGGVFWSRYGWSGVVLMISVMLVVAFILAQRLNSVKKMKPTVMHG